MFEISGTAKLPEIQGELVQLKLTLPNVDVNELRTTVTSSNEFQTVLNEEWFPVEYNLELSFENTEIADLVFSIGLHSSMSLLSALDCPTDVCASVYSETIDDSVSALILIEIQGIFENIDSDEIFVVIVRPDNTSVELSATLDDDDSLSQVFRAEEWMEYKL